MKFRMKSSVMIVDDNPINIKLLESVLQEKGYDVRVALSGVFALESASKQAPDIILLDINMPDLDGYEVCRKMKQHQNLKNVPVIFISAKNDVQDKIEGFRSGGVDYIEKPFNSAEVLARIETHLRNHIMQDMIVRQYDDLARMTELKDRFFHMIIHDMRSPLQGISGCLELLRSSPCNGVHEEGYLMMMDRSVRQLIELCSDAIDINKMESTEISLVYENLDIVDLFKKTIYDLSGLFLDKEVSLESSCDRIHVHCDPSKTKRIIQNLLSNASKFSKSHIFCTVQHDEEEVTVRIKDDGPGIFEGDMTNIFEKYYQADDGSKFPHSSGLGLSFCKMAVEKQGGRIGVNSLGSEGTEFWFTVRTLAAPSCEDTFSPQSPA